MIIYKNENQIVKNLKKLKSNCSSKNIILHSDILNLGFFRQNLSYNDNLKLIHDLILDVFNDFEIIVPVFNYDFLKTKFYDVNKDKAQVGALNEYFRKKYISNRTFTPVFNFVSTNKKPSIKKDAYLDPHGEKSFYSKAYKHQYDIVFLGKFIPSMAHFVERKVKVPYRYYKKFYGKIKYLNGKVKSTSIDYNVRPPFINVTNTDLEKIKKDLKINRILFSIEKRNSFMGCYNSRAASDFWINKQRLNNLYFLTNSSQKKIKHCFSKFGKPLTYKNTENITK
jgi:aminoglycoside N3'-acetyltransferase